MDHVEFMSIKKGDPVMFGTMHLVVERVEATSGYIIASAPCGSTIHHPYSDFTYVNEGKLAPVPINPGINDWQETIAEWAKEKGWWNYGEKKPLELLALIVTEVAECIEAYRNGNPPSQKAKGFSQAEEELADVIIRVLHMAAEHGFDIDGAIREKMSYNSCRSHRHGGKKY